MRLWVYHFAARQNHQQTTPATWAQLERSEEIRRKLVTYDLVIKNGMVIDGSGMQRYRADVGVRDGKIASMAIDRHLRDEE